MGRTSTIWVRRSRAMDALEPRTRGGLSRHRDLDPRPWRFQSQTSARLQSASSCHSGRGRRDQLAALIASGTNLVRWELRSAIAYRSPNHLGIWSTQPAGSTPTTCSSDSISSTAIRNRVSSDPSGAAFKALMALIRDARCAAGLQHSLDTRGGIGLAADRATRIFRPRQLYVGPALRDYVAVENR